MIKGEIFTIDRWRNGEIKEYKVARICRRFINVKSLDGVESWGMPYDRLKDINPINKIFVDDTYK